MPFTLCYEAGFHRLQGLEMELAHLNTFLDILRYITNVMEEVEEEEDFEMERIIFYDREYRRISFGDEMSVEEDSFIRVVVLEDNANLLRMAHHFPERTQTWPWSV